MTGPTFSWSVEPHAEAYELVAFVIGEGGGVGREPALSVRLPAGVQSWTPSEEGCLARGARYAWSIRATAGAGTPRWSHPALIEVTGGPSAEELANAITTLAHLLQADADPSMPRTIERPSVHGTGTDRPLQNRLAR